MPAPPGPGHAHPRAIDSFARVAFSRLWHLLFAATAITAITSLLLTLWFDLHPCHLCIFQRLLFMLLALLSAFVIWGRPQGARLVAAWLFLLTALGGAAVAAYQSWLQWRPPGGVTCDGGPLGPIERLVEWLGQLQPELFLATGLCADKGMTLGALSLANLAFLAFLACAVLAGLGIGRLIRSSRENTT